MKRITIMTTIQIMSIKNHNIKTGVLGFGFFVLYFSFLGCKDDVLSAQQIIERTVETHGGLDQWQSIQQLSFDKETTLFLEDGTVERKTDQFQLFEMGETPFGKIEWVSGENDIQILFENGKISKTINDSLVTNQDDLDRAEKSFWAALHVVRQPFDLLNDHVTLELGDEIDVDGQWCYEVMVTYEGDDENSDRWSYIIDKNSFEVVANKVILKDHSSWVENLTFDTSTDFKFNAHRKSYRLNDAGEKTYLRAEYFYSNYSVLYQ